MHILKHSHLSRNIYTTHMQHISPFIKNPTACKMITLDKNAD